MFRQSDRNARTSVSTSPRSDRQIFELHKLSNTKITKIRPPILTVTFPQTDRQTESNCNTHYAAERTRLTKSALFSQVPLYQVMMHIKIISSLTATVSPKFSEDIFGNVHKKTWFFYSYLCCKAAKVSKLGSENFCRILDESGFGGLEVACWPLVPKFAGSNPTEAVGFLRVNKILSTSGGMDVCLLWLLCVAR